MVYPFEVIHLIALKLLECRSIQFVLKWAVKIENHIGNYLGN